MITNFKQIGDGQKVRLTLHSGIKLELRAMNNDRAQQVLWVETDEGCFAPISYSDIHHASIPLIQN